MKGGIRRGRHLLARLVQSVDRHCDLFAMSEMR